MVGRLNILVPVESEDAIKAAFEFYESCKKGAVKVNHDKEEQT